MSLHATRFILLMIDLSIRFFMLYSKPENVTWPQSWKEARASSGKWFIARFFAIKNCTASRLKSRDRFLHSPVMCQLDVWIEINEFLILFRRLKCSTATWRKTTWCHQKTNALLKFVVLSTRNCKRVTANCRSRFAVSKEKPDAKGL